MNKRWYGFGNSPKVRLKKHFCYKCNAKLAIVKHSKIVQQNSLESEYYSFKGINGTHMMGPCEFIHRVFYCSKCLQTIEFVTQINLENIDTIIKKIERKLKKRNIRIKKLFETQQSEIVERIQYILDVRCLRLEVFKDDKELAVYKVPIARKRIWERPQYFKISKRELLKRIKEADK